jgi:hypothetical protein
MHQIARLALATVAVIFASGGIALAQVLPPPLTVVQAPGPANCSVTAAGPQFAGDRASYGGQVACNAPYAGKTYEAIQVVLQGKTRSGWTNVAIRYSGNHPAKPSSAGTANPVTLTGSATALTDAHYRVWAWTHLMEPDGYAGCSMHGPWGCYKQVQAVAISPAATAP